MPGVRRGNAMQTFHDHYIIGYRIDGGRHTVELELVHPDDKENITASFRICFRDVQGYLLEHDLDINIVLAIEERPVTEFLHENEALFSAEMKWGWPLFWQGSVGQTTAWLSNLHSRVWEISTSYGLSGWVVAREIVVGKF